MSDTDVVRREDLERAVRDVGFAGYEGRRLAHAALTGDVDALYQIHDLIGMAIPGVTEHVEGDVVRLVSVNGRWSFCAINEGGLSSTLIDAADLVDWISSADGKSALEKRGIVERKAASRKMDDDKLLDEIERDANDSVANDANADLMIELYHWVADRKFDDDQDPALDTADQRLVRAHGRWCALRGLPNPLRGVDRLALETMAKYLARFDDDVVTEFGMEKRSILTAYAIRLSLAFLNGGTSPTDATLVWLTEFASDDEVQSQIPDVVVPRAAALAQVEALRVEVLAKCSQATGGEP